MRRVLAAGLLLLCSCSKAPEAPAARLAAPASGEQKAAPSKGMTISSPAFKEGDEIPMKYGCAATNVSPPLLLRGIVPGARSLALIVEDPDAPGGPFSHWVVWNIPPWTNFFPDGVHPPGSEGINGYGKAGYGGPCPPSGEHHYVFRLFELDSALELPADSRREQLLTAMAGHIIGEARLVGRYGR